MSKRKLGDPSGPYCNPFTSQIAGPSVKRARADSGPQLRRRRVQNIQSMSSKVSKITKNSERLKTKGAEKKTSDTEVDHVMSLTYANDSTGNFHVLHTGPRVSQGNANYQRQGQKIQVKSVHTRLRILVHPTDTLAAKQQAETYVRLIGFIDYQTPTNSGILDPNDLLANVLTGSYREDGFRNMFFNTRFRTLVDEVVALQEMFSGDAMFAMREYNFKLDLPVQYSESNITNTTNWADVQDGVGFTENSIRWVAITSPAFPHLPGDPGPSTNIRVEVKAMSRYRYTDN